MFKVGDKVTVQNKNAWNKNFHIPQPGVVLEVGPGAYFIQYDTPDINGTQINAGWWFTTSLSGAIILPMFGGNEILRSLL